LHEIELLRTLLENEAVSHPAIKGIAHITGGGFAGNIVRILPAGMQAVVQTNAWNPPPLFQLLAHLGQVTREETYHTFNMGIGLVIVVSQATVEHVRRLLPEALPMGFIKEGEGVMLGDISQ
jgi:phosphoribosylaminoimidazole (AIR) synthetase